MSTIGPGMLARTKFWRSRTPGEVANPEWCGRLVHVGARIPAEELAPKFLADDKTWFEVTFLDGTAPETHTAEELTALAIKAASEGKTIKHVWLWPAMGLVPLDGSSEAAPRKAAANV